MKREKIDDVNIMTYQRLVKLYHKESARAAVVLATSYLELFLGKYIKSFMRSDIDEDELFGGFGPFATFSQRIKTAYAFGLISKEAKEDLTIIKQIRNYFAHHPENINFRSKEVKQMCDKLSLSKPIYDPIKKRQRRFTSREVFLFSIGMFTVNAHNVMLKKKKTNSRAIRHLQIRP